MSEPLALFERRLHPEIGDRSTAPTTFLLASGPMLASRLRTRLIALLFAGVVPLITSCAPVAPTSASAVPVALRILFVPCSESAMSAYLVDSDEAYTNVTSLAEWRLSDPPLAILQANGSTRSLSPLTAGTVRVLATYGGLVAEVSVAVAPSPSITPRFTLQVEPLTLGRNSRIGVFYNLPVLPFSRINVTNDAVWSSSEPSVMTVERGNVTVGQIGTSHITVSYAGESTTRQCSVLPQDRIS